MSKPADISQLAEDARALMSATADVAGDKVVEARKRLAAALENTREFYGRVKERAAEGVKAADATVRANPYQAIAISVGIGAIVGCILARRCARKGD